MSSTIIKFPTATARSWIEFEKLFRDLLESQGMAPAMIDGVCGRMRDSWKNLYAQISFAFEIPPGLPDWAEEALNNSVQKATKSLTDQIHEYLNRVLLDRLLLEIELYRLRHGE
ncbi:MAG TPA: hypothetical protein VLZ03_10220 [Thermodesulfobacteriota bacterium]|nr:hypothetical protein [Thermodesulfobacteriota bacterium]